jgi:hypothetical protein
MKVFDVGANEQALTYVLAEGRPVSISTHGDVIATLRPTKRTIKTARAIDYFLSNHTILGGHAREFIEEERE